MDAFKTITVDYSEKLCIHTKELEDSCFKTDHILDSTVDPVIISFDDEDDSYADIYDDEYRTHLEGLKTSTNRLIANSEETTEIDSVLSQPSIYLAKK